MARPSPPALPAPLAQAAAAAPARLAAPAPVAPAPAPAPAAATAPAAAPAPAPAASVTVTLPPARPVAEPVQVAAAPPVPAKPVPAPPVAAPAIAEAQAAPAAPAEPLRADPRRPDSPRLQRLSLAEVALLTTGVSRWRPHVVAQTAQSTRIRFVPLKRPQQQAFAGVRLLNAARSQGLAAHTRAYLNARGWRRIAIGDAEETRDTSIIYYPESRRRTAEILAAQFRIRVARRTGEDQAIVMLLGRDAARVKAIRTSA